MGALHRLVAGVRNVARTGACQRFHRARLSLGSPPMRAIRRFTVRTTLPEPLAPPRRAGGEPALVLAPAHPRPVRRRRPPGVGAGRARPGAAARRGLPGAARRARRGPAFLERLRLAARGPAALPARPALVPAPPGRGRRSGAPDAAAGGDRLLLARVRHHRGAPAVLRRPGHPGRRPPQGGQRPRRAARRRRAALPQRLLPPVAVARRLAAGDLPGPRPARPAAHPAARRRRHARCGSR